MEVKISKLTTYPEQVSSENGAKHGIEEQTSQIVESIEGKKDHLKEKSINEISKGLKTHLINPYSPFGPNEPIGGSDALHMHHDGYPHFKLELSGLGEVDCIYDPRYRIIVIPKHLFDVWKDKLFYEELPNFGLPSPSEYFYIQIGEVVAFNTYSSSELAIVIDGATQVVSGKNITRQSVIGLDLPNED